MKGNSYLSYSGRNCEAVLQVMGAVIREGFGLVCDCMLPAHASFEEWVTREITDAKLVVAVMTEDAAECVYMDRELAIALETGARMLPIVVGNAPLPEKYEKLLRSMELCYVSEYPTEAEMEVVRNRINIIFKHYEGT